MKTSSYRIVKEVLAATVVLTLFTVTVSMSLQTTHATSKEDKKKDRQEVTVEVVGEEPAQDIEESKVPLAASPHSAAEKSTRSMIIIWAIAAAVLAYAVFLLLGMKRRKIDKKLRAGTEGDRGNASEGGTR